MPAPKGHPPYPGCEKGGRPRKYSLQDIERFADEFMEWLKDSSHIWIKDFTLEKQIDPDLMSEWAVESEKFNGVLKFAKKKQESLLCNGALTKTFSEGFTKFVLVNHHEGWKEKSETTLLGDAANPLSFIINSTDGKTKDLIDGD